MAIYSGGQTVFSFFHIEDITLGAGEEVDEVAGGASGMGVDENMFIEGHILAHSHYKFLKFKSA